MGRPTQGTLATSRARRSWGEEEEETTERKTHIPTSDNCVFPLCLPPTEEKYITVQPYTSQSKDEIGFEKGVTVEVIRKNLEGWWYIR